MRSCIITLLLIALTTATFAGEKSASLDELIDRAQSAPLGTQPALYAEIAERQLAAADKLYDSGDSSGARSAVEDVVAYSRKASQAAADSGNRMKPTEIALRKMAQKLRTIRRTLEIEDQKPVEEAANRLEALRTELLSRMFEKNKKKGK